MSVVVDMEAKTLTIDQEITFYNQTNDTITSILLNDWNNAFSEKYSPLGKRFSDEFYNKFHMALEKDCGGTINLYIEDEDKNAFVWERTKQNPDYIKVLLKRTVLPNQKIKLHLSYVSKIPSDKFTKYGHFENYGMHLKNWFLTPARYDEHQFVKYSNENLDDIANAVSDFDIDKDETLYIGDDDRDLLAAKAANIEGLLIGNDHSGNFHYPNTESALKSILAAIGAVE